jgi:hypothetical protein
MKLAAIDYMLRDMPNSEIGIVLSSTRDCSAGASVTIYKTCKCRNCLVPNLSARIGGQDFDEVSYNVSDAKTRDAAPLTGEAVQGDFTYRRDGIAQGTAKRVPRSIASVVIKQEQAKSPCV